MASPYRGGMQLPGPEPSAQHASWGNAFFTIQVALCRAAWESRGLHPAPIPVRLDLIREISATSQTLDLTPRAGGWRAHPLPCLPLSLTIPRNDTEFDGLFSGTGKADYRPYREATAIGIALAILPTACMRTKLIWCFFASVIGMR